MFWTEGHKRTSFNVSTLILEPPLFPCTKVSHPECKTSLPFHLTGARRGDPPEETQRHLLRNTVRSIRNFVVGRSEVVFVGSQVTGTSG